VTHTLLQLAFGIGLLTLGNATSLVGLYWNQALAQLHLMQALNFGKAWGLGLYLSLQLVKLMTSSFMLHL
jgi:hypothetical protein